MKKLLITLLLVLGCSTQMLAKDGSDDFDFLLALTQQDAELDWWTAVPAQFGPKLSTINSVSRGEYFKILPIFNNYGTSNGGTVNITYDLTIQRPDGSTYEQATNCIGCQGKSTSPHLIPATAIMVVCFEPEDPFGEYTIRVIATDHVKAKKVNKEKRITLEQFVLPEIEDDDMNSLFFKYPTRPQPSKALAAFLQSPRPYIDEKGQPLWSVLWFYKQVFEENGFLIPHAVSFFNGKATEQQKKDILLLFYLMDKVDMLAANDESLKKYRDRLKVLNTPNPYSEILTGDQLDMLWAEYFATSRVKPIRQILTALNLSKHAGTLEQVKAGELDVQSEEVRQKAMLEAVFQSAIWSIRSNCEQSSLLFQYCVGLYESEELNKIEKSYLGVILRKTSDNKGKQSKKQE